MTTQTITTATLSYTDLSAQAKALGFSGTGTKGRPSRAVLEDFIAAALENAPKAKRAYRSATRGDVAQRRLATKAAVEATLLAAFTAAQPLALTASDVHREVLATVPDARWNDTRDLVAALGAPCEGEWRRARYCGLLAG